MVASSVRKIRMATKRKSNMKYNIKNGFQNPKPFFPEKLQKSAEGENIIPWNSEVISIADLPALRKVITKWADSEKKFSPLRKAEKSVNH